MSPFDRGLLLLYTFTFNLLLLLGAAVLAGFDLPLYLLKRELGLPGQREIIWFLLGVYVIMGFRLMLVGAGWHRGRQAVVQEGALGQVKVALHAIESLVEKVVSGVPGVREVKPKVLAVPKGISIQVKTTVTPDVNIPAVADEIQERVRERVLNVTGITVHDVRVSVENISSPRTRVE